MSTTDPNAPADLRHEERTSRASVSRDPARVPLYRFIGPRYWGVWLGIAVVRLVNLLPLPAQMWIGRRVGSLALAFSRRDRRTAQINIDLCLPELDPSTRRRLLRE
ncbi:MAG: hypothetical protein ACJ8MH_16375, partial [Povalibacter sp.]